MAIKVAAKEAAAKEEAAKVVAAIKAVARGSRWRQWRSVDLTLELLKLKRPQTDSERNLDPEADEPATATHNWNERP